MVRLLRVSEGVYRLDVRGYTCPYPVIYARKAMARIPVGAVLEVLTDNPPSCDNVPKAMEEDGQEVLGVERSGQGVWIIRVSRRR